VTKIKNVKTFFYIYAAHMEIFRLDALAAAEYPDKPNVCRRRKSPEKYMATAEF